MKSRINLEASGPGNSARSVHSHFAWRYSKEAALRIKFESNMGDFVQNNQAVPSIAWYSAHEIA